MQITDFHDAPSVTAQYLIEERQRAAARTAIIAEARGDQRHRRAYFTGMGHLLVRIGEWLQAAAQRPAVMEETV